MHSHNHQESVARHLLISEYERSKTLHSTTATATATALLRQGWEGEEARQGQFVTSVLGVLRRTRRVALPRLVTRLVWWHVASTPLSPPRRCRSVVRT
ncbi:hypothetical protein E2C01_100015 [Portunus trituberculatus]|uniref:Uncharacterized protein n=1 Tax=Portunus trituberculatus TaxID=210409 RepID=A0A5B7KC81_PORTR|nr:hypothetical protein [Portunus trituberculatus]